MDIANERTKRESINIITRSASALKTVNLNRDDANIDLFCMLVDQIANAAANLVSISTKVSEEN